MEYGLTHPRYVGLTWRTLGNGVDESVINTLCAPCQEIVRLCTRVGHGEVPEKMSGLYVGAQLPQEASFRCWGPRSQRCPKSTDKPM